VSSQYGREGGGGVSPPCRRTAPAACLDDVIDDVIAGAARGGLAAGLRKTFFSAPAGASGSTSSGVEASSRAFVRRERKVSAARQQQPRPRPRPGARGRSARTGMAHLGQQTLDVTDDVLRGRARAAGQTWSNRSRWSTKPDSRCDPRCVSRIGASRGAPWPSGARTEQGARRGGVGRAGRTGEVRVASSATLLSRVRERLRWISSSSKVRAPMDAPACARTAPAVSALGVRAESAGRHTDHRQTRAHPQAIAMGSIHITGSLPPSLEAAGPAGRGEGRGVSDQYGVRDAACLISTG
jgi:hypothetical protein